jgi:hypothetical protein
MSRSLSTEMQAVSTAELVRPVLFVDCYFDAADGGQLNFWSGIGQITYNSKLYVGAGNLLSVSQISENTELAANGVTVLLSGIGEPLISKARDADYQGRTLEVSLGALDENSDIISSPVVLFSGFMDVMNISSGGETATISVTVENRLIEFDRTRVRRNTAEDQKIDYPTDKGFEFVAQIQEKEIVWGNKSASPISYGTGSGSSNIPSFRF